MAQEKTTTMADGTVSKVTALPEGCTLALFDSSGGVSKIDAQKFMELVRGSIQIGGRNLLKGTATPVVAGANRGSQFYDCVEPQKAGTPYMLSFDMDWTENVRPYIEFFLHTARQSAITERDMINALTLKKGHNKIIVIPSKGNTMLGLYSQSTSGVTISNVKLEEGNVATAWCPAFEDYQEIGGGKSQIYKELQNLTFATVPKAASAKRSHRRPLTQRNRILSNLILN